MERPGHAAVTSTVTMTEILVKPYRTLVEKEVRQIFDLLLTYPNLEWIAPDLEIAQTAARVRARYKLETPDALQAATAIRSGATGSSLTTRASNEFLYSRHSCWTAYFDAAAWPVST